MPRPDVSQQRREQILDAATQVFARKGLDRTRMDDLVDETGLSKGALYWYFHSKDDIIFAVIDRIFQREFQQPGDVAGLRVNAVEAIRRFTDLVIKDLRNMLRLMPIAYECLALALRNTAVQRALTGYLRRYHDTLTPLVQHGINTGEFRRVDPAQIAITAGAIIEGTLLLWIYDRESIDPATHIRSGVELLLRGLAA